MNGPVIALYGTAALMATPVHTGGPFWGKAAIIAVFALVLIWLIIIPARFIGQDQRKPPFWKNTRYWAIVVAVSEILIYFRFG